MRYLFFIAACFFLSPSLYGRQQLPVMDSTPIKEFKPPKPATDTDYADPSSDYESIRFLSKREFWFGISTLVVLLTLTPIIINFVRKKNIND